MTSIVAMRESNRIRVWSGKNSQSLIDHGSLRRADRLVGRGIAYRSLCDINWRVHTIGSQRFVNMQEATNLNIGVGVDSRVALSLMPKLVSKS